MTNYKIPSFEECLEIVKFNECFTHRYRTAVCPKTGKTFQVSMFDYLLASYNDFNEPVVGSDLKAFELRGLCFTHDEEGKVLKRFLLLPKFFNLNQCQDWQLEDLKDGEIVKITDKLDGSVMRFIDLPNGEIVVKSKTFFDNDQTKLAMQVFERDANLQAFIRESIDSNLAAVMELTSNLTQVVILYPSTELTLLQLRDEVTGEMLDVHSHPLVKKYGIKVVEDETLSLIGEGTRNAKEVFDKLSVLKTTIVNKEGWISHVKLIVDGSVCIRLVKSKGDEYCRLHGIHDKLSQEHKVLEMILNDTIDDAISQLDPLDSRRDVIANIAQKTVHYLIAQVKDAQEIASRYKGDKKEWAIANLKEANFPYAAKVVGFSEDTSEALLSIIKKRLMIEVNTLFAARRFIKDTLKVGLMHDIRTGEDE